MKSFWKIATVVACVALVCGAAIAWHYVRLRANERKLVEDVHAYRTRAEQDDPKAEFNLGRMYHQGKGVPQDYAQALYWYRKAANQKDARAQYVIGYMYCYGQGVERNYADALNWYRKAAEQSDRKAEYAIGLIYYNGQGVPEDHTQAAQWFRRAADHGLADAQHDIGYLYYYGLGLERDRIEAGRWFRKAAEQGNKDAQRTLASRRHLGTGSKIQFAIAFLGSIFLLAGSKGSIRNRQQQVPTFAALGLLIWLGLALYGHFYISGFESALMLRTFYFIKSLVGGISAGLLLFVTWSGGVKIMLGLSSSLVVALNIYAIARSEITQLRAFYSTNGLLLGMSLSLAILLYLGVKDKQARSEPAFG